MILFLIIYILNKTCITNLVEGTAWIFCKYYLDDLICLLIVLPYIEILLIIINQEINSFLGIFIVSIICAIIWELIIPSVKPDSISDPIDFLCYIIGGIIYWIILSFEMSLKINIVISNHQKRYNQDQ